MAERLYFHVLYVGSAALVAFLAVCVSSSQIGTFRCDTSSEQCELVEPAVAAEQPPAASKTTADGHALATSSGVSMAQASLD